MPEFGDFPTQNSEIFPPYYQRICAAAVLDAVKIWAHCFAGNDVEEARYRSCWHYRQEYIAFFNSDWFEMLLMGFCDMDADIIRKGIGEMPKWKELDNGKGD